MTHTSIERYLQAWSLQLDGVAFETPTSWIQPVRRAEESAILKLFKPHSDERHGAGLLRYWGGDGAVALYEADADALLMERAMGSRSLTEMACAGRDLEATEILADTLMRLQAPRQYKAPASLVPLADQFAALFAHANDDGLLCGSATVARRLLAAPVAPVVLHGDLHHANVLDAGARGWLAIDPKALFGERTYDVANLLRNPAPHGGLVLDRDRMQRLATFYAECLTLEPQRILDFAFAHAGLSAAWDIDDGLDPVFSFACAELLATLVGS